MDNYSDFLFAAPDFIGGLSRVLDIGSSQSVYNDSLDAELADARAMARDWRATGADVRKAMATYQNSVTTKNAAAKAIPHPAPHPHDAE